MEFLEKYNLTSGKILKILGFVLLAIVLGSFVLLMISSTFNSITGRETSKNYAMDYAAPSLGMGGSGGFLSKGIPGLSQRNAEMFYETESQTAGSDAEEFEVTDYSARIETGSAERTCAEISGLKARDYVIFENANQSDQYCHFSFKVEKNRVEEILNIIKGYNPKDLSENIHTIKNVLDDYTGEVEILEKKLATIDDTLAKAISAYDDVTALATRTQDVESLAQIIDSKINIIERLTNERVNINSQIEWINRSKGLELDRLDYTNFSVDVYEIKYIDAKNISESWKGSIRDFVTDLNQIAQNITVNLVKILLFTLQYLIYLLILLFIVKYGWKIGKHIWQK